MGGGGSVGEGGTVGGSGGGGGGGAEGDRGGGVVTDFKGKEGRCLLRLSFMGPPPFSPL